MFSHHHCRISLACLLKVDFIKPGFCQNFIGIEFLYEKIYEISSIENLIAKTDFYYQFRMCIFKTNFFGIRLTICSIVSSFLFWRYLKLFPFVDYITNISRVNFFLIVILLYVEVLFVVLSSECFEYYNFLYASSFPCIYFWFVSEEFMRLSY
jgi:hypothetical protein